MRPDEAQSTARRLLVLGALAALAYLVAFVGPYSLSRHALLGSPADVGKLSGYPPEAFVLYVGTLVLQFVILTGALRLSRGVWAPAVPWIIVGAGLVAGLVLCWSYPFAASDVFLYIVRGRVLGIYGQNSLVVPPNAYPLAPYLPFPSEWADDPSPYGPLWEWLAALLARWGDGSLQASLLAFKLSSWIGYALCLFLLWRLLRSRPGALAPGLLFFAWNPLVLIETCANGHNDIWVAASLLGAVWAWQGQHVSRAVLALVLGGAVKYVPLLLIPPLLVLVWRQERGPAFWRRVLPALALGGVLLASLLATLWPGWERWGALSQLGRAHASVGVWLMLATEPLLRPGNAVLVARGLRLAFLLCYGVTLYWVWRRGPALAAAGYVALFAWMTLGSLAFGHWYLLWLVALAAGMRKGLFWRHALLISAAGLLSVVLYTFVGQWTSAFLGYWRLQLFVVPLIFVAPWLWVLRSRRQIRRQAPATDAAAH